MLNRVAPRRGLPGLLDIDTDKALIVSSFPPVEGWPSLDAPDADRVFEDLQTATRAIRDIRQKQNIPPKQFVNVTIKVPAERVASLRHEAHVIRRLARVGELLVATDPAKPAKAATLVIGDMQIFVADVIDAAAERRRLEKDLANLDKLIAGLNAKLGNQAFVAHAPAEVVERERGRLADLQAKRQTVLETMSQLE